MHYDLLRALHGEWSDGGRADGEAGWGGGGGDSLFGLIRSKQEIRCTLCCQARRRKCSERYARVEFWTLSAHHTNGCTAVDIENRYNHIYSSTLCLQPGYLRLPSLVISHDLKKRNEKPAVLKHTKGSHMNMCVDRRRKRAGKARWRCILMTIIVCIGWAFLRGKCQPSVLVVRLNLNTDMLVTDRF